LNFNAEPFAPSRPEEVFDRIKHHDFLSRVFFDRLALRAFTPNSDLFGARPPRWRPAWWAIVAAVMLDRLALISSTASALPCAGRWCLVEGLDRGASLRAKTVSGRARRARGRRGGDRCRRLLDQLAVIDSTASARHAGAWSRSLDLFRLDPPSRSRPAWSRSLMASCSNQLA
jgi:hypothetical protein